MKKLLFVFGTRPEAIKLAPVIRLARGRSRDFAVNVCTTGQHREMLGQVVQLFDLRPDCDLAVMQPNQSLAGLTARLIEGIDGVMAKASPDVAVVQGDTTTTFAASLVAFYRRIPVAHVEAGLRTGRLDAPFPEEANRTLTSRITRWHFAPTALARENLLRENVVADRVHVTGNTVIDALMWARDLARREPPKIDGLDAGVLSSSTPLVLITGHRRENFGPGLEASCRAIRRLAQQFPRAHFVYPVHLNPNVQEPVRRILGNLLNVHLIPPLPYLPFVALLDRARFVLTDSGGIQEEAPSFRKPVLVMRDTTERPEAVEAGAARLVGTSEETIVAECARLLSDDAALRAMQAARNPYGDGNASQRILDVLTG